MNKYQENQTVDVNNLDDYKKQIADYLKKEYSYTNIKGIEPEDSTVIDGGWIVEQADGTKKLIFATRNENGTLSITFGEEKQVNSPKTPETEKITIDNDTKNIEEEIDEETKKQQLVELHQKYIINDETLSEEDIKLIETYNNEEEFYKLPEESREICQEILNAYNGLIEEKQNEKNPSNGRQYRINPPKGNNSGMAYVGIVTFLSGVITGIFVYLFYRMFI